MIDSRIDAYQHIQLVQHYINTMIISLIRCSEEHDQSKLLYPEKGIFDKYTPALLSNPYGSPEYIASKSALTAELDHHYKNNRHHPQYFKDGIKGMNLIDIVEMFCDWKAATMRHEGLSLKDSIEINQGRFGYSDDLKQIFLNTIECIEEK